MKTFYKVVAVLAASALLFVLTTPKVEQALAQCEKVELIGVGVPPEQAAVLGCDALEGDVAITGTLAVSGASTLTGAATLTAGGTLGANKPLIAPAVVPTPAATPAAGTNSVAGIVAPVPTVAANAAVILPTPVAAGEIRIVTNEGGNTIRVKAGGTNTINGSSAGGYVPLATQATLQCAAVAAGAWRCGTLVVPTPAGP
jgi:hypothetical protein